MKSTQTGWVIIAIVIGISIWVLLRQQGTAYSLWTLVAMLVIFLLFFKLTIEVSDDFVKFSLGIGLINGKYHLDKIEHCKPIRYTPLGWGIRWRPGVIMYNVSGNKAIELKIKGKTKRIWIGTQTPDAISEYINGKINSEK